MLAPPAVQSCVDGEFPCGFAIEGRIDVVVVQRHGLKAAVDDHLLGERGIDVSDRRAAALIGVTVDPGLEDPAALVVRVALEVIDRQGGGEAPDRAGLYGPVAEDLVDPPVVGRDAVESPRFEGQHVDSEQVFGASAVPWTTASRLALKYTWCFTAPAPVNHVNDGVTEVSVAPSTGSG